MTIIRHTAGAISAFVAILLVVPLILQAFPVSVQHTLIKYMPLVIAENMAATRPTINDFGGATLLSPWTGFAPSVCYAAAQPYGRRHTSRTARRLRPRLALVPSRVMDILLGSCESAVRRKPRSRQQVTHVEVISSLNFKAIAAEGRTDIPGGLNQHSLHPC